MIKIKLIKAILITFIVMVSLSTQLHPIIAVYDPLSVPNNLYGVHILDPNEIDLVPDLVNSNGGKWGYVVVPIRSDDRDRIKWSNFFTKAKQHKIIPIIRLATYGRGDTWVIPTDQQMIAFANFLNQFSWPTKNRYIILFNEINHSQEWGGFINPEAYAKILLENIKILKHSNSDYFILPAAMDMAAPQNHLSITALNYWKRIFTAQPELIQLIDGWNSHAYPNPAFSGRPTDIHSKSIQSYKHELKFLADLGRNDIPVFITETGWDQTRLNQEQTKQYWEYAYQQAWRDPRIVTVAPFILQAHDGPFVKFSLLNKQQQGNLSYNTIKNLPKINGEPILNHSNSSEILSTKTTYQKTSTINNSNSQFNSITDFVNQIVKFFSNIFDDTDPESPIAKIGETTINLEIAASPNELAKGLGHRASLPKNHGMLFVMPNISKHKFWMKNTFFPLDIIWIHNNKIVDITEQIPVEPDPDNPQNFYSPSTNARYVIEVNAGFIEKNNIKIGDSIKLVLNK